MSGVDQASPGEPAALEDELAAVIAEVRAGREPGEATTFGVALRVFLARLRLSLTVVSGHTEIGEDTLGLARAGRPQRYLTPEQISQLVITLAELYPERLSLARYSAWLVALHGLVAIERTIGYLRRGYGGGEEQLDVRIEARLRLDLRALLLSTIAEVVGSDLERLRLSRAGRLVESAESVPRSAGRIEIQARPGPSSLDRAPMRAAPPAPPTVLASMAADVAPEPAADAQTASPLAAEAAPPAPTPAMPARARFARPVRRPSAAAAPPRAIEIARPPRRDEPDVVSEPPTPLDAAADADALLLVIDEAAAPDLLATLRTALARLRRR